MRIHTKQQGIGWLWSKKRRKTIGMYQVNMVVTQGHDDKRERHLFRLKAKGMVYGHQFLVVNKSVSGWSKQSKTGETLC